MKMRVKAHYPGLSIFQTSVLTVWGQTPIVEKSIAVFTSRWVEESLLAAVSVSV